MSRTDGLHTIDLAAPGAVLALLDFHRGIHGHAQMNGADGNGDAGPQRPDGVTEDEWSALGDPGKRALVRERDRATRAEQDLATARAAKPTPPKEKTGEEPKPAEKPATDDIAAIVKQAVDSAIKPFQEREQKRDAEDAARRIADAVTSAAKARLRDPSDALHNIDLADMTNGAGAADPDKINAALDDLVTRKPYLARVADDRRRAGDGSFVGATAPHNVSLDDQVKTALAAMQSATGVKLPADA